MTRAGAHAGTGFAYQDIVSAALLLGVDGLRSVSQIVPEGDSDVDATLTATLSVDATASRALHVDAKGHANLSLANLAEAAVALARRTSGDTPEPACVVITPARNAGDLAVCGWDASLAATSGETGRKLRGAFAKMLPIDQVERVLGRTHLIVAQPSLQDLAYTISRRDQLPFLLAEFIAARLLVLIRDKVAEQRSSSPQNPATVTRNDVANLIREAKSFDATLFSELERTGLLEWADFGAFSAATHLDYLLGVAVTPATVARLSVLRSNYVHEIDQEVGQGRTLILLGPSGSGKSTLMWQVAGQAAATWRVVRLDRCPLDHLGDLRAFFDALLKDPSTQILVCADDIGSLDQAGFTPLAQNYRGERRIQFLATCRDELFDLGLVPLGGRTFPVSLSQEEALALGEVARGDASLPSIEVADVEQAWRDSNGRLMEFMCLLIAEQPLVETLARQANEAVRWSAERHADLRLVRAVLTADLLGSSIPWRKAAEICGVLPDPSVSRLKDGFIAVDPRSNALRGLHRLRSQQLVQFLHQEAPLVDTIDSVFRTVEPADLPGAVLNALQLEPRSVDCGTDLLRRELTTVDNPADTIRWLQVLVRGQAILDAALIEEQLATIREWVGPEASAPHASAARTHPEEIMRAWRGEGFDLTRSIQRFAHEAHATGKPEALTPLMRSLAPTIGVRASLPVWAPKLLRLTELVDGRELAALFATAPTAAQGRDLLASLAATDVLTEIQVTTLLETLGGSAKLGDLALLARVGQNASRSVHRFLGAVAPRWERLSSALGLESLRFEQRAAAAVVRPGAFGQANDGRRLLQIASTTFALMPELERLHLQDSAGAQAIAVDAETCTSIAMAVPGDLLVQSWRGRHRPLNWSQWLTRLGQIAAMERQLLDTVLDACRGDVEAASQVKGLIVDCARTRHDLGPAPTRVPSDDSLGAPIDVVDGGELERVALLLTGCEAVAEVAAGQWQASPGYARAARLARAACGTGLAHLRTRLNVFGQTNAARQLLACEDLLGSLAQVPWRPFDAEFRQLQAYPSEVPGLLTRVQAIDQLSLMKGAGATDRVSQILARAGSTT